MGLFGSKAFDELGFPAKQLFVEIQKSASDDLYLNAKTINDSGISMMSLSKRFPFFMFFPEPLQGWDTVLTDMDEYQKIFSMLAEPDLLRCLYFIHTKQPEKKFSLSYFLKMTGLEKARAEKVLESLAEMKYVEVSVIDLDDARQTFYSIIPNHVFVMLLLLMETYTKPPKANAEASVRKKPFFYKGENAE